MSDYDYGTPEFKEWWMGFWGHIPGTPEGDAAWEAKCALMEGRHLRRAPMVLIPQDIHYQSPVDGRVIRSRHEREDDLKRNNCIEYDPGMKQDYDRRVAEADASLDRSVDQHVERSFATMPTAKKERLANEIAAGATPEYSRLTATGG